MGRPTFLGVLGPGPIGPGGFVPNRCRGGYRGLQPRAVPVDQGLAVRQGPLITAGKLMPVLSHVCKMISMQDAAMHADGDGVCPEMVFFAKAGAFHELARASDVCGWTLVGADGLSVNSFQTAADGFDKSL